MGEYKNKEFNTEAYTRAENQEFKSNIAQRGLDHKKGATNQSKKYSLS